jgi:periplasmic protein TonB
MKTKHVESLEDMVFRNKNKLYGAYALRRKYSKYLTLSLIITLFLMLTGMAYPVIASFLIRHIGTSSIDNGTYDPIPVPPVTDPPALPPPPPPSTSINSVKFVVPKLVMDSVESDFGKQDILADNKPLSPLATDPDIAPVDNKPEPVIPTNVKPEPLTSVGEMPAFPGGDEALFSFLKKNLRYPQEAKETGISGIVYITFVVEINGAISEVAVVRGISSECDEEAMRVVRSMPDWTPGKQNNTPVRVRFNLPVRFTLL